MLIYDGHRLRQSWSDALNAAQAQFRQHLASTSSSSWKRVPHAARSNSTTNGTPTARGKARASHDPDLDDISIHRRVTKGADVYRVAVDVTTFEDDPTTALEAWKAVLSTPEMKREWDPAVEGAHFVEMFDPATRITKTNYTLGWPANPRDAVTISRSFHDSATLVDISTSLPRSLDEPVYLRPSPPYVRSHVDLQAWCIQFTPHSSPPSQDGENANPKPTPGGKIRILCFWQHDLKSVWTIGSASAINQQLPAMVLGLFKTVKRRGYNIPVLTGYGLGLSVDKMMFEVDRESLTIDYSVIDEQESHHDAPEQSDALSGLDRLEALREQRRLLRCIECALPSSHGWDMQITTRASSEQVSQLPWTAQAIRQGPPPVVSKSSSRVLDKTIFRVRHAELPDQHSILKVKIVIEASGASKGLRLNGMQHPIEEVEERDPMSYFMSKQMLQDASSATNLSFQTGVSASTMESADSASTQAGTLVRPELTRMKAAAERTTAMDKSISSRVRRNYIYFSSLLQEPEAKWKQNSDARGVSVTQLDSIDPTLVVFRAEATFVGVGLWDLYAAVTSPGTRVHWDKQHEDAILLEDVNEMTQLWHFKTRPAWPVNGRDSVVLKTVYKSPTTIHVFSFSVEDPHLFPNIPPTDPNVIRTQVDLQGWTIEALSPTTTSLTLLEQSDPKGWTNKASIPQQMIATVAGVGEFAIRCGGPPIATRLEGAKANQIRYEHEKGKFHIEYKGSEGRRGYAPPSAVDSLRSPLESPALQRQQTTMPVVECELRCDIDTWSTSLDVVVDPPPQTISCLRRHRLSAQGGGLWLTIGHDAVFVGDERLLTIVRRAPLAGKEKGIVMVNGAKVAIDVEELPDNEVKALAKQKRVKPQRIPLDQPPVLGVIRRRRAEWDADGDQGQQQDTLGKASGNGAGAGMSPTSTWFRASTPSMPTSLASIFGIASGAVPSPVSAISPTASVSADDSQPSRDLPPMHHALTALTFLQTLRTQSSADGWTVVSDKGIVVHRKLSSSVSSTIPVHKGQKVIEGVSADEIASVVTSYGCRKQWDDRFDSATVLEEFGAECHTAFVVTKGGFPFRDRGFYLASLTARFAPSPNTRRRTTGDSDPSGRSSVIFCISASFNPDSVASFSPAKYNSYGLPIGRVLIDGWILETLDPYTTTENYAIPSTRCTRVVAVDLAGSVPVAVNSMINATLPKSLLAVETYLKGVAPLPSIRLPGSGLVIADRNDVEDAVEYAWKIKIRDRQRSLVTTKYDASQGAFRCSILVNPATRPSSASPLPEDVNSPRLSEPPQSGDSQPGSPPPPPSPIPTHVEERIRTRTLSAVSTTTVGLGSAAERFSSLRAPRSHSRDTLRTASSAFTIRGEVRTPADLILAELVVDSNLYPNGYNVFLRSRIRETDAGVGVVLPPEQEAQTVGTDAVLPIVCTLHAIPSSPLHSSGLTADRPTRHLLKLSLPTASFQRSTIEDPLTGEVRSAPVKPPWLLGLEEQGAIVDVFVRPGESSSGSKTVSVDGKVVPIVSEKESLVTLGREYLEDERLDKLSVLSRVGANAEAGAIPETLTSPLAIAEHLRDRPSVLVQPPSSPPQKETDSPSAASTPVDGSASTPLETSAPQLQRTQSASKLMGFLSGVTHPLANLRFTSPAVSRPNLSRRSSEVSIASAGAVNWQRSSLSGDPASVTGAPSGRVQQQQQQQRPKQRMVPLSMVWIIAIISFLIGSLLRSLLSPADFIYVATDLQDAEVDTQTGWREIRRLVEMKYVAGGWDLQVAVVRRH